MTRLRDWPDWRYVLTEFDGIYRRGSAGGSAAIRSHQRQVRERLSRVFQANPEMLPTEPTAKPVVAHLGRAIDLAGTGPLASMAKALDRIDDQLSWAWGYDHLPKALAERYAYAELLGPRGPVIATDLILGLVLLAPSTVYPQHSHDGIEESYVSLAGAWSENDAAVYAPGSLILNRAGQQHRLTVGDRAPCLLAYAWIATPERLAKLDMHFAKSAPKPRAPHA
ncbi:MAG: dimethlysulfonioproprionate lyase DddL [Geminicoccaceae bacterium]|nr:MAG: dimethlysulfonioproprionate lyase DddL [Geminicoccaceae bacterium]